MAMLSMTLRVVYNGVTRVVTAGPPVLVAFERQWGIGIPKAFMNPAETKVEHLAWVAHQAILRAAQGGEGEAIKPFNDWLESVEDIAHHDDEAEAIPLD
jgi:hypothetical protein